MTLVADKDGVRTLHFVKCKDFEGMEPVSFKLEQVELPSEWSDDDAKPATSAVLVPCGLTRGDPAWTPRQQAALDLIGHLAEYSGRVSRKLVTSELIVKLEMTDRKERWRVLGQLAKRGAIGVDWRLVYARRCRGGITRPVLRRPDKTSEASPVATRQKGPLGDADKCPSRSTSL